MISRNLLIGFGLGLLFSASFLTIFPSAAPEGKPTQEQLEAYAKSQNYVLVPKKQYDELVKDKKPESESPKAPTSPQDTTPPQQVTPPTTQVPPANATSPNAPVPPTGTDQPETSTPPAANTPSTPTQPTAPVKIVTITIPYNSTAKNVARMLVDAGLLPENNNFVTQLKEKQKLNRIRVGTYKIPTGTSVDEIIRIITTPPPK
ncbi:hypothetical protein [Brevibacillus sp. SYSU BS000544]|uniref:hypothetical protein n=1 Tax=Brevibacillus sp. SYSU BS000544 TaxID=3416443 RepID=UPI003CE5BD63